MVWDVSTATALASLDDPLQAAAGQAKRSETGRAGAVRGLAWVMTGPAMLAIALASGMFVVWDTRGEWCALVMASGQCSVHVEQGSGLFWVELFWD